MIGPPYVVRNKSRYVTNISQLDRNGNNSFPVCFIIIVKRGNMLQNREDNIVKWL
ncbi:hypothetical protein BCSAG_26070 [Bacillus cereus]